MRGFTVMILQEGRGGYDAAEERQVPAPRKADWLARGLVGANGLARLLCVASSLDEEIRPEENRESQRPFLDESQRPEERHAREVAEKQRRISERREASAYVRDDEDEEEDRVRHMFPLRVDLEHEADEQHGRARRPDDRSEEPADQQQADVRGRMRRYVSRDADARRDHVERAEEEDERDVFGCDVAEGSRSSDDDRQRREARDEPLKAGPAPSLVKGQRQDGDREKQGRERQEPDRRCLHRDVDDRISRARDLEDVDSVQKDRRLVALEDAALLAEDVGVGPVDEQISPKDQVGRRLALGGG